VTPEVAGNIYLQNVGNTGHIYVLQRPKNRMFLHTAGNNFYNQEKGIKTKLHGVTCQKNLKIVTAVKTSNLSRENLLPTLWVITPCCLVRVY
jgi:hypothetical protein